MKIPGQLLEMVRAQSTRDFSPGLTALADAARALHGKSVRAVLFYGSCLRSGDIHDGLADLYLLVDDYRAAFGNSCLALCNRLLPPNVFYLEVPYQGRLLRAKYAVLTLEDFRKGTERWFHSYLWGRFAQQSGLVYACDAQTANQVHEALAAAVMTFVGQALPQMDSPFSARDIWARGLSLSYRAELRPEQPDAAARLFDADPLYYRETTHYALEELGRKIPIHINKSEEKLYRAEVPAAVRRANRAGWRIRSLQGKLLSVLRLLKGLATFRGGIDYILWKIERHSGERVEVGPALRRVPPLAVLVVFWRLYRRGAFR